MKKIGLLAAGILVLFFFGCASSQQNAAAPGGVTESSGDTADNRKVVTFYVTGKGLEPEDALTKGEAVIMAERAAVADGYRQMVEKIRGVYIDAMMKAGRGTVSQETIQVQTQSWLRGADITEITRGEYGITHAKIRLRIHFSKEGLVWWPDGMGGDVEPVVLPKS